MLSEVMDRFQLIKEFKQAGYFETEHHKQIALVTPLQIEHYLTLAIHQAYDVGEMPVSDEIINSVVARDIDDLEPRLTRYGYDTKIIAKALNVRPTVIRSFFRGQLPPGQT